MRASDSSTLNASRKVGRDTPNCAISTFSEGRASPSSSSPRTIWRRRSAATSSAIFGTRTVRAVIFDVPLALPSPFPSAEALVRDWSDRGAAIGALHRCDVRGVVLGTDYLL